jgi:hypothetical protein
MHVKWDRPPPTPAFIDDETEEPLRKAEEPEFTEVEEEKPF